MWTIDEKQASLILDAMIIDPEIIGAVVYDESEAVIAKVGTMTAVDETVISASEAIEFESRIIGRLEVALTDRLVQQAARDRLQIAGAMAILFAG